MDPVLTGARTRLSTADAVAIGAAVFGVDAQDARDLGGERDRTFLLLASGGEPLAVLKVSNPSEDPEVLDMEAGAALHIASVDPTLRVPLPRRPTAAPGDERRADWRGHWVRLYDVLPGRSRIS